MDWVAASYREQIFNCENKSQKTTLDFARERSKPVIIVAVPSAEADWSGWFVPLFDLIRANNDVIRGLVYSNVQPGLFDAPDFLRNWKTETAQPFWLRGAPGLFSTLGY